MVPGGQRRPVLPQIACSLAFGDDQHPANAMLKLYTSAVVGLAAIFLVWKLPSHLVSCHQKFLWRINRPNAPLAREVSVASDSFRIYI